MKLFGTSGIRGIYGKEITKQLAYDITSLLSGQRIVVGRDTRESGIELFESIADTEKEIIDLGVVPTPTLALATMKYNCYGMMITASHNPPDYNGLKIFKNGAEITRKEETAVENKYKIFTMKKNNKKITEDTEIVEEHKKRIKEIIAKTKNFKVVIDCNGAGAALTPYLIRELGCKVISVNCEGIGFNRPSEPNQQNLGHLKTIIKATNSDIGFAHDGDADRVVVLDENGQVLPLDVQLAIMIENELEQNPGKKIVSTVEASLIVRETIEKNDGKSIITRVSSVEISELMETQKAAFGGEPCGEYIFNKITRAPDGPFAVAKFLDILQRKGKISELTRKYQTYPIVREKFTCKEKYEKIKKISDIIMTKFSGEKTTIDGIRVDEKDGWFLVRASGTEPIIRLTAEYKSEQKLKQRVEELRKLIVN